MNELSMHRSGSLITWLSAICFLCVLVPLVSFPSPSVVSGHPWKVELFASVLLLTFLVVGRIKYKVWFLNLFEVQGPAIRRVSLLLFLFFIWSGLSFFWAASVGSVIHHTFLWGTYLTLFVLTHSLLSTGRTVRPVLLGLALASTVLTIACLSDYFSLGDGLLRIRYGKYAELLVTIAPVLWAACLYSRAFRRGVPLLLAGSGAWLAAMLSLSKGALIAGVFGFGVFFAGCFLFSDRAYRHRVLALAGFWLVLTIGTQVIPPALTSASSTSGYISGASDPTRDTSRVRIYIWAVTGGLIANNWLAGVGADNFGTDFNRARPDYESGVNTSERDVAEHYMVERAHNEILQIFAELGTVGIVLFGGAFAAFGFNLVRTFCLSDRQFSPMLWGSLAGLAGFFVSSQFSSFSFRVMQNGIVFFMVFVIALYEVSKIRRRPLENKSARRGPLLSSGRLAFGAACVTTLMLAGYSSVRCISYLYQYEASQAAAGSDIQRLYERAEFFDPENGGAYFSHAQWRAREGDHSNAWRLFKRAIDLGVAVTASYSLMAKSQILSGRPDLAEETLAEATKIFPRSIFARVRYSALLEEHLKPVQADAELKAAQALDQREANGWYCLIKEGSTAAAYKANLDPGIVTPADLRPENAVYEFLNTEGFQTERKIDPGSEAK